MARRVQLLFCVLMCCMPMASAQVASDLTGDALRRVLALGPWPPAPRIDPGNRVSGDAKAIELGRHLFRDPRMSPLGYIACVTCHQPDRSFTDFKPRAHGLADLPRNTPALANLDQQRWFGWGGSSDSLWMASIRPILDAREFDGSSASVTRLFVRDPELASCYRQVFGVSPLVNPQRTLVNVGKALAAYVETLTTGRTPFDEFRDALARRDMSAAASYPVAALRGLTLFIGRAGCVGCHAGPNFSDGGFHPGVVGGHETTGDDAGFGTDAGRLDDARSLKASPLNLLSQHNDLSGRGNAAATRRLVVHEGLRGQYRTPSLRNVAVTAPYLHDGRIERLRDAVQHRAGRPDGQGAAPAEVLSAPQVDDVVAFLATLTDRHAERRPWIPSQRATRCP